MAYFQFEPWGEERADLRSGIVASTIANVNRGKNTPAFKPEDFMPKYEEAEKADQVRTMTVAEYQAEMRRGSSSV